MATTTNTKNNEKYTEVDLYMLGHHLRLTAEKYAEHAETMRQAGFTPAEETFVEMQRECQRLADLFQYEDITKVTHYDGGERIYFTSKEVF